MADPVPCSPLPEPSLGDAARRLYDVLRIGGHTREWAVPQSLLATVLDLPVRTVQEGLALELLAAGVPVATTCGRRERCCPRCAGRGVVADPPGPRECDGCRGQGRVAGHRPGMYLAATAADLEPYLDQLASRHRRLGRREKLVRACHRRLAAHESTARTPPADPSGQLIFAPESPGGLDG